MEENNATFDIYAGNTVATVRPPQPWEVTFVFGLVSTEEDSPVDGYLAEIDRIAKEAVSEAVLDFPRVKSVERDSTFSDPAGRVDISRRMITISIPFRAPDALVGTSTKDKVIESMRFAISNDSLKPQI